MYRASHRGTIIVVDDTPSIGDVARGMRAAVRARLLHEVQRDSPSSERQLVHLRRGEGLRERVRRGEGFRERGS